MRLGVREWTVIYISINLSFTEKTLPSKNHGEAEQLVQTIKHSL